MSAIDRAFVAVVPPPAVLDALEARVSSLRADRGADDDDLRWSRREQWHLTLRFLGRVADEEAVADVVRAAVAATDGFALQLGGGGAFRRVEQGTVLWVGMHQGGETLARLATAVESAAVSVGYEPESREFAPHLTLARANRPHDLRPLTDALGDAPICPSWMVDDCVLLSSDTRPSGAVYEPISHFALRQT